MKKNLLFFAMLTITSVASAQIKITTAGNVGIGNNTPAQKLHVIGETILNGKLTINAWTNVIFDWTGKCCSSPVMYPERDWYLQLGKANSRLGDIYTTDIYSVRPVNITSDKRAKENIAPLENPIEKIKQISGYRYNLRREIFHSDIPEEAIAGITKSQIGFLAQEVEKVFPELVTHAETEEEFCSMSYDGMIPILLEAIKEQQMIIEALQQKVEQLEETLIECCNINSIDSENSNHIQQLNFTMPTGAVEEMKVYQNAPNPFNVHTTIQCYIPQSIQKVELCIYNMQGAQLKCLTVSDRGAVNVQIQAGELSSGVFTYLLIGDGRTSEAKQMILTK